MEVCEIAGDFQYPDLNIRDLINIEELHYFKKIDCTYSESGRPIFKAKDIEMIAIDTLNKRNQKA